MSKVPVLSTVSRTWGFVLGDFATILQIAWLPLAVATGLNFHFGQQLNPALVMKGGPEAAMQASALGFGIGIVALLANIMVTVALLRVVMYGQRPGAPFYLWFGMAELRTLLAYVLLTIALIAAVIAGSLVLGLAAAATAAAGGGAIIGLVVFLLVAVLVWAMIKLTILPAVIVAENTLGVERAWELSRGNAFRLFVVYLLTYLPFAIVTLVAMAAVIGSAMPDLPDMSSLQDPQKAEAGAKAFEQAVTAWQLSFTAAIYDNWLAYSILNFVTSIVSAALFAGIAGNAYLSLAGEPPAAS